MNLPGLGSSCSSQIPFSSILAFMFLSAEHETPRPIGQLAPWRGMRITRTSSAKFAPPNCAPIPNLRVSSKSFFSSSMSRKACPSLLPSVGRESRYLTDASFTVLRHASALVPPTTHAIWYGGHAAVPRPFIFSTIKGMSFSGVIIAFVS